MRATMSSPVFRIGVSAVCLLLHAGCEKHRDGDAPDLAAAVVAYSNDKPLPESRANRLPAFQHAVLALVAGEYAGECNSLSGPVPRDGLRIGEDGSADSSLWHGDLLAEGTRLTLGRFMVEGAAPTMIFSASGAARPWSVTIGSGNGGKAMFGMGASVSQCTGVAAVAAVAAKPLYPAVARLFSSAATTLHCVEAGITLGAMAITPGLTGITVGNDRFDFAASMSRETIAIEAGARTLQYSAAYDDGSSISLTLNAAGKLQAALGKPATGPAFICSAPAV